MKYQIFYLSLGSIYKLSSLEESFDYDFDSPEEASTCLHGWIDAGLVDYPKLTFVILPVIKLENNKKGV